MQSRTRGILIVVVAGVAIVAIIAAALAWFSSRDAEDALTPDPQEIIQNIPEAEVLWFSQTQDARDEVCSGLASSPDEYYALMKETWLDEAGIDPGLFGALMTTIIDDCGL